MADLIQSGRAVEEVTQKAMATLEEVKPSPFSPHAFDLLKNKISLYVTDLVNESIKVSRRYQADTVSAAHVERASEYLVTNTSRRVFRHLGTLGGILLGAAISNILSMVTAGQYTPAATIASILLGIIGAFLVALHIAKE